MITHISKVPLFAASILLFVACDDNKTEEDDSSQSASACSSIPVAIAEAEVVSPLGDAVQLSAEQSEWCSETSDTLVFTWSFLQTPVGSAVDVTSLSDNRSNTAVRPIFTPDVLGDYVLTLQLSDDNGDSDEVIVVVSVIAGNEPPVADCGGSYVAEVGTAVVINGSNAYDPENQPLEYEWTLSTPDCSTLDSGDLRNTNGANPSFVPDCEEPFEITMVVGDSEQWSDPVVCVVNVGQINQLPVADAGEGGSLRPCAQNHLPLDGFGSYDMDGDALSYEWSLVSAPSGSGVSDDSFSNRISPEPAFAWDVEGTYVLQLQVFDGQNYSSPDLMSFTIGEGVENKVPVANAGEDQDVELTVTCTSSSYVWTCPRCPYFRATLDGSESFDDDGDVLDYLWSEPTNTAEILNPTAALTSVRLPPIQAVYNEPNEIEFEFTLAVSDCQASSEDDVKIFYSCEGEN